jgi:hypothetical protein
MNPAIQQTERVITDKCELSLHLFDNNDVVLGVYKSGISVDVHIKPHDLVALGDAIQRIIIGAAIQRSIAGEDRGDEKKECDPIVVGS